MTLEEYAQILRGESRTAAFEPQAPSAKVLKARRKVIRESRPASAAMLRRVEKHGSPVKCPLCDVLLVPVNTAWDHDHELEHLPPAVHFRDWLCKPCNSAIGLLKDNPEVVLKAAAYLQKHEERRRKILAK